MSKVTKLDKPQLLYVVSTAYLKGVTEVASIGTIIPYHHQLYQGRIGFWRRRKGIITPAFVPDWQKEPGNPVAAPLASPIDNAFISIEAHKQMGDGDGWLVQASERRMVRNVTLKVDWYAYIVEEVKQSLTKADLAKVKAITDFITPWRTG